MSSTRYYPCLKKNVPQPTDTRLITGGGAEKGTSRAHTHTGRFPSFLGGQGPGRGTTKNGHPRRSRSRNGTWPRPPTHHLPGRSPGKRGLARPMGLVWRPRGRTSRPLQHLGNPRNSFATPVTWTLARARRPDDDGTFHSGSRAGRGDKIPRLHHGLFYFLPCPSHGHPRPLSRFSKPNDGRTSQNPRTPGGCGGKMAGPHWPARETHSQAGPVAAAALQS